MNPRTLIACALLATASGASLAGNISLSLSGEVSPGVYGRVDIGRAPPPMLVYAQPLVYVQPVHVVRPPQPIYLHVPPGHAKNWGKQCGRYNACSRPVYFIRSAEYEPSYGERGRDHDDDDRGGKHKDKHKDKNKGHGKGHGDKH